MTVTPGRDRAASRFPERLARHQCGRPAEVVVQARRFHNNHGRQHKNNLQQRSGRKDPVQQRHVMLPRRRIGHSNARYNDATHSGPETQKSPAAARPPGGTSCSMLAPRGGALQTFMSGTVYSYDRLSPVQRVRPRPGMLRPVQAVARANKIVCGGDVIGCVRNHPTPTIAADPGFHGAHQTQLQAAPTMLSQHGHTVKIPGIVGVCRWNDAGKSDRQRFPES